MFGTREAPERGNGPFILRKYDLRHFCHVFPCFVFFYKVEVH